DAALVEDDAGPLEIEPLDVGLAPDGDEERIGVDGTALARRELHPDAHHALALRHHPDGRAGQDLDALGPQPVMHDLRGVLVFLFQDLVRALEYRGRSAEPRERLAELACDRPAADDDQAFGLSLEAVEDGLVREVADVLQSLDRRNAGARAGGNDEVAGRERHAVDVDDGLVGEAGMAAEDGGAAPPETLLGIVGSERGAEGPPTA